MLYATGMRLDELCHLRCADIIHSSMKIYIRHSKNHSDRYVPLTESIWQMILDYWYTFPAPERPREWLFTQQTRLDHPMDKQWIQREVLLLRRSLGMDSRISAHSFRHAYATRCYENGMDLLTLKAYLGHSSINSTCIYVRLAASYKEGFPQSSPIYFFSNRASGKNTIFFGLTPIKFNDPHLLSIGILNRHP